MVSGRIAANSSPPVGRGYRSAECWIAKCPRPCSRPRSRVVALEVVCRLEVIQVDVGQGKRSAVERGPGQLCIEHADKRPPIQYLRERIRSREAGLVRMEFGQPRHQSRNQQELKSLEFMWKREEELARIIDEGLTPEDVRDRHIRRFPVTVAAKGHTSAEVGALLDASGRDLIRDWLAG